MARQARDGGSRGTRPSRNRPTLSAFSLCRWARRSSVSRPLSTTQALNGEQVRAGVALERQQLVVDEVARCRRPRRRARGPARPSAWSPNRRRRRRRIRAAAAAPAVAKALSTTLMMPCALRQAADERRGRRRPSSGWPGSRRRTPWCSAGSRRSHACVVARVDRSCVSMPKRGQQVVDQPAARAERGAPGDDVVARLELAQQRRGHRRHARSPATRQASAPSISRDPLLEHRHGRVLQPRVGHARGPRRAKRAAAVAASS